MLDYKNIVDRSFHLELQKRFEEFLSSQNHQLYTVYKTFLDYPHTLKDKDYSELLLQLAPYLEDFLAELFSIKDEVEALQRKENAFAPLIQVKRQFIQRYALKKFTAADVESYDPSAVQQVFEQKNFDYKFAEKVLALLENEEANRQELDKLANYAAWATLTEAGKNHQSGSILFCQPQKIDFSNLLSSFQPEQAKNHRDGFSLTDFGLTAEKAADQAHYCIVCHKQGKDSCSKGMASKNPKEDFAQNPLGVKLKGCPLDQKISEMNSLKADGFNIAALATIMIDNPLLALTGHRICNDCMKSCIYQKQDPVNIPGIESQILKSVLSLPCGFEIYHLLSRWNPLNIERPVAKEPSGYKILVVGAGPAGLNLAYHLLQEGHTVVIVEGAKVEPHAVSEDLIKNYEILLEDLDKRTPKGVGGVAEYGITVRWDKNNLTLVREILERHAGFKIIGGVRFGGTITTAQAFDELGFDHIALCCGAGRPNLLNLPGIDAKGIRYASDFLMNLQHGGAFLKDAIASMDLMLPAIVIGGGLTSIDTSSEVLAYYPRYCEKIALSYESLTDQRRQQIISSFSIAEKERLERILEHHKLFEDVRGFTRLHNTAPDFLPLLKQLGGVKLIYRKEISQSPAYRLNHEEVLKALEEGIEIIEEATPLGFVSDAYGFVTTVVIERNGEKIDIEAASVLIATGTSPNTNITEDEDIYSKDNFTGNKFVTYTHKDSKTVTFFGDMHPNYNGNVVKAMASAKDGYPKINKLLEDITPSRKERFRELLSDSLLAKVHTVRELSENIYDLEIYAPYAAKNFKPGQFYKLQNYATPQLPAFEPIAATGARVDLQKGIISTVLLDIGASTHLARKLKPGDSVVLMGPTGQPSEIPENQNVLLIGGGVGNAVLFSVAEACKRNNCKIVWIAGYKKKKDIFYSDLIERFSDQIIYACDEQEISTARDCDVSIHGNILSALEMLKASDNSHSFSLKHVDHVLVVGSNRMMQAVQSYFLKDGCKDSFQASINAPMQCMLKGVCATCLQKQADGSYIYTCAKQDQKLKEANFETLSLRLSQNSISEMISTKSF